MADMQRISPETDADIDALVALFTGCEGVSRKSVTAAAARVLLLYIRVWQREGQDLKRIWSDITNATKK